MRNGLPLPKRYLSYSQMKLWLDNKEAYRRRYYDGVEEPKSPELMFGSEMAKGLEDGTIAVPGLVRYPVAEWRYSGDIGGVPFAAYLDTFWPDRHKFREYKTGKVAWTQKKVEEHMQLDVYSLVVQEATGDVDDECHLDWIVTRNKAGTMMFDGHELTGDARGVEVTGELVTFSRVVTALQRDRMREVIRSVANEIGEDYRRYLALNPSSMPDSSSRSSSSLSGT